MSDASIRFLLDGVEHRVANVDPNTSTLEYLREHLNRRGTKEGCAEGDCGACTVVVAETDGKQLRYRPVNACIALLASLDGRELLTVESLAGRRGALHPVQAAMVEHHGSQCGFCTPGIVMSLFALYKRGGAVDRETVDQCLAGNLCRCTGYRPIIDAAMHMHAYGEAVDETVRSRHEWCGDNGPTRAADEPAVRALNALQEATTRRLAGDTAAGARAELHQPRSLAATLELMQALPHARLIAGGTDMVLEITKELRDLACLIHLGRVPELHGIEHADGLVRIGAATPLQDVADALAGIWPALDALWAVFASPPVRHAATLGGNIANGSPVGDSMPALMALEAAVVLTSRDGERRVPLDGFYTGYRRNCMRAGELIRSIELPMPRDGERLFVRKVSKRRDQDISAVLVAMRAQLESGRLHGVRIACGGMAATPARAIACEQALEASLPEAGLPAPARTALQKDFQPMSDHRASAAYRAQVAANVLERFLWDLAPARQHG